jgi:hypothetical protein
VTPPEEMPDDAVAYMLGHMRGWIEAGGELKGWADHHGLSTNQIIALRLRLDKYGAKLKSDSPSSDTIVVDLAWAVVWDQVDNRLAALKLDHLLEMAIDSIADEAVIKFAILSIWPSQEKADIAVKVLSPHLIKRTS